MSKTVNTAQEQLITLLNTYRTFDGTIDQFAHYQSLTLDHTKAVLWLAGEVEKLESK